MGYKEEGLNERFMLFNLVIIIFLRVYLQAQTQFLSQKKKCLNDGLDLCNFLLDVLVESRLSRNFLICK